MMSISIESLSRELAYINAGASMYFGHIIVNKESKNTEKYKALFLQGH